MIIKGTYQSFGFMIIICCRHLKCPLIDVTSCGMKDLSLGVGAKLQMYVADSIARLRT